MRTEIIGLICLVCCACQGQLFYGGRPIIFVGTSAPTNPPSTSFTNVFVMLSGNDSNDGFSTNNAKRTVAAGLPLLTNGGMTMFIGPGQFIEQPLTQYNSGSSPSALIRVTALDQSSPPVISITTNLSTTQYGWPPGYLLPNNQYVMLDHIILDGPGYSGALSTNNSTGGFIVGNTNATGYLDTFIWSNVVVRGFNRGIDYMSSNSVSGTTNSTFAGCVITNCNYEGIRFFALGNPIGTAHKNILIANCEVAGLYSYSDNGFTRAPGCLVIMSSDMVNCQSNILHDSGTNAVAAVAGSGGITFEYTTNPRAEWNVIWNMRSSGSGADGYGIDMDHNVANSLIRYNVCYSNDGPGITLIAAGSGHTIEGNIMWFDCLNTAKGEFACTSGGASNLKLVNNTLVNWNNNSPQHGFYMASGGLTGTNIIANNILVTRNASVVYTTQAELTNCWFVQNDYFSATNVSLFSINGTTYSTLANFRTGTGQETGAGFSVDPQMNTLNWTAALPTNVAGIASFQKALLSTNSPLWHVATNLATLVTYTNDMSRATVNPAAFNLGAWEPNYN